MPVQWKQQAPKRKFPISIAEAGAACRLSVCTTFAVEFHRNTSIISTDRRSLRDDSILKLPNVASVGTCIVVAKERNNTPVLSVVRLVSSNTTAAAALSPKSTTSLIRVIVIEIFTEVST